MIKEMAAIVAKVRDVANLTENESRLVAEQVYLKRLEELGVTGNEVARTKARIQKLEAALYGKSY